MPANKLQVVGQSNQYARDLPLVRDVKKQTRMLVTLALFIIVSTTAALENSVTTVRLENGYELQVKEIHHSRILPHAYYDQALASIPDLHPNSRIIVKRRLGHFRNGSAQSYSLVCYKKSKDHDEVTISGVITSGNKAWSFDTIVAEKDFADTLLLVFETIIELPFQA